MKKNIKLILLLSLFFLLPGKTKAFEIVPSGKNEYGESYKNITIEDITNAINNDTKEYTKSLTPTLNNKYETLDYIYYFESASSMALAAVFPAPIAEITVAAPVTASPPA